MDVGARLPWLYPAYAFTEREGVNVKPTAGFNRPNW